MVYYDVWQLFGKDNLGDNYWGAETWKTQIHLNLDAYTLASAASIDPDRLNKISGCSKKVLSKLQQWTFIRGQVSTRQT